MKQVTIIMQNSHGEKKYFEISCKTESQIAKEVEKYEDHNPDYYTVEVVNGWVSEE